MRQFISVTMSELRAIIIICAHVPTTCSNECASHDTRCLGVPKICEMRRCALCSHMIHVIDIWIELRVATTGELLTQKRCFGSGQGQCSLHFSSNHDYYYHHGMWCGVRWWFSCDIAFCFVCLFIGISIFDSTELANNNVPSIIIFVSLHAACVSVLAPWFLSRTLLLIALKLHHFSEINQSLSIVIFR